MINHFIKKQFFKPQWKLAIRQIDGNEITPQNGEKWAYSVFEPDVGYWCADPFLFEKDEQIYVFCECYIRKKHKGSIAVIRYKDGVISDPKVVIDQKYHMSYPCVFQYNNCYYMIPETCDNNTIELYKAVEFPDKWVLDTVLKKDIKCLDPTVFCKENQWYVLGYEGKGRRSNLLIFKLNMDMRTLQLYAKVDVDNAARPAGNLFYTKDNIIRPSQDCRKKYGGQILMNEVLLWEKDNYDEKVIDVLGCENIEFKEKYRVDRIHTVNRLRDIEIIDFSQDKFDLLRGIKILGARLRRWRA